MSNPVFDLASYVSEESQSPVMRAVLGLVHGDLEEFADGYAAAFEDTCEHIAPEGSSREIHAKMTAFGRDTYQDFCLAAVVLAADLLSQLTFGASNMEVELLKRELRQRGL